MDPAVTTDDRLVATLNTPVNPTAAQQSLRITEIMYDPPAGGAYAAGEYEFIELMNTGAAPLNLNGAAFDEGITFSFGALTLAPGERIVLAKNAAAYAERYPTAPVPAGIYTGALDNSGERLRILDATGEEVLDFRYEGTWYPNTHGSSSLVIEDPLAAWNTWGTASAWHTSATSGGNPGAADALPAPAQITSVTGGTIHLTAEAGRTYILQRSNNLGLWEDVGTTVPAAAAFDMTDSAALPRAFYRVKSK